jgi:SOS-response transcriptional repressor LexA
MITASQCRAARALTEITLDMLVERTGIESGTIGNFERRLGAIDAAALARLQSALEELGAIFLDEDEAGGVGVRLKFASADSSRLMTLENEGGETGEDEVV